MFREILVVGAGGAAGSMVRYLLSGRLLTGCTPGGFPVGTFVVNVTGAFLIGLFAAWFAPSPGLLRLTTAGFCGGFTTFTAESVELLHRGNCLTAGLYIGLSIVVGIAGTLLGLWLGERAGLGRC